MRLKSSYAQCVSLAGCGWKLRDRERLPRKLACVVHYRLESQMQDQQDENKRPSSVTVNSLDMPGSRSNEDSASPVSVQRDGRASSEAHPKKKRKVNHGQELRHSRLKQD